MTFQWPSWVHPLPFPFPELHNIILQFSISICWLSCTLNSLSPGAKVAPPIIPIPLHHQLFPRRIHPCHLPDLSQHQVWSYFMSILHDYKYWYQDLHGHEDPSVTSQQQHEEVQLGDKRWPSNFYLVRPQGDNNIQYSLSQNILYDKYIQGV